MNIFVLVLIITILFIIWSEYSVTNILIRQNSKGNKSFNLNSLFGFLIDPFYQKTLWTCETLDINYAFVLMYTLGIYYLVLNPTLLSSTPSAASFSWSPAPAKGDKIDLETRHPANSPLIIINGSHK